MALTEAMLRRIKELVRQFFDMNLCCGRGDSMVVFLCEPLHMITIKNLLANTMTIDCGYVALEDKDLGGNNFCNIKSIILFI